LSAVKEFGNMESEIYKLRKSQAHLADLLQLLKVAVRGLGRIGKSEDIYLLDHLKNKAPELIGLGKAVYHEELIHQIQLTLLHEIGHHFGFSEEEMDAWETEFDGLSDDNVER